MSDYNSTMFPSGDKATKAQIDAVGDNGSVAVKDHSQIPGDIAFTEKHKCPINYRGGTWRTQGGILFWDVTGLGYKAAKAK
jgi:hypothetical protein